MLVFIISVLCVLILLYLFLAIKIAQDQQFDTYFHIFLVKQLAKYGINFIRKENTRLIRPGYFQYPFFIHWLIARCPASSHSWLLKYINFFLHIVYALLVFVFCFHVLHSLYLSWFAMAFYLLTPAFYSLLAVGPRVKGFTPRMSGELLGSLYFVVVFLYLSTPGVWLFVFATFLGAVLFLSSKFSVQALLFGTVLLSLFTWHISLVVILFLGFLLANVLSSGLAYSLLIRQLKHLGWYFVNTIKGNMPRSDRNSIKKLYRAIASKRLPLIGKAFIMDHAILGVLFRFPVYYFTIFAFISILFQGHHLNVLDWFFITATILFVAVNVRWLLFIGEAERYLNYFVPFILVEFLMHASEILLSVGLVLTIIFSLFFIIGEHFVFKPYMKKFGGSAEACFAILKKHPQQLNVATIPYYTLGGWRILAETEHNWLYNAGFWTNKADQDELDSLMVKYPVLDLQKVDQLIERYQLDLIFIRPNMLPHGLACLDKFLGKDLQLAYYQDTYILGRPALLKLFVDKAGS